MSGHRQSALLLHGLNKADQHWVLKRLATNDQKILRGHLAELINLGIPVTAVQHESDDAVPAPSITAANASTEQIFDILRNEPLWLVGRLLAAEEWPWRDGYLAMLSPAQRLRLASLTVVPLTEHTKLILTEKITRRLQSAGLPPRSTVRSAPASGIASKLLRLFGRQA